MDFETRLQAFIEHCNAMKAEHQKANGFNWPADTHEIQRGKKWAKIVRREYRNEPDGTISERLGAVYAFVALIDFATKELGTVRAGDIHKPASWAQPAKHRRGSIYQADFGNCAGPYGIAYMK